MKDGSVTLSLSYIYLKLKCPVRPFNMHAGVEATDQWQQFCQHG